MPILATGHGVTLIELCLCMDVIRRDKPSSLHHAHSLGKDSSTATELSSNVYNFVLNFPSTRHPSSLLKNIVQRSRQLVGGVVIEARHLNLRQKLLDANVEAAVVFPEPCTVQ